MSDMVSMLPLTSMLYFNPCGIFGGIINTHGVFSSFSAVVPVNSTLPDSMKKNWYSRVCMCGRSEK
jgi:hypothetical protein